MTEYLVELPARHPGQQKVLELGGRFRTINCGRRFGKTVEGVIELCEAAVKCHPHMQGKEYDRVAWFAPNHKYSREPWEMVHQYLASVIVQSNSNDKFVRLVNGVRMDFWSLDDPDSARGFQYGFAVVDEAAKVAKLEQALQYTILPTLLIPQGHLLLLSTPRGRDYWYYLCNRHHEDPNWSHMVAATGDNPYVNPDDIEGMKRDMTPRAFKQEVMAEFLDNSGGVFRGIEECIVKGMTSEPPMVGNRYYMGVDLGRVEDYTVIVILDENLKQVYHERIKDLDWNLILERIVSVQRDYNAECHFDATGLGQPVNDVLARMGAHKLRPFVITHKSKMELITNLALKLSNAEISLQDIKVQTDELEAFEYFVTPSGNVTARAASGHDDCVIALALAAWPKRTVYDVY